MICPACESDIPGSALSCPQCRTLIHSQKLEELAQKAKNAWRLGHFAEERAIWTESLALLPEDTVQHRTIQARITEIVQTLPSARGKDDSGWKKASLGAGPALLLLLSKGKLLLLGLTKIGTLLTMFASLGVYWALYGWELALGLVISIYIHEMGHVTMIKHYGFHASAPMFIPGLGAFIQLRGVNLPPVPESRVGLAGPMYGTGAALLALGAYYITGVQVWGVIAHLGAWLNLFNLIPVWQLDGSRGLRSLTRTQRGLILVAAATLWLLTSNPMLILIALGCGYRIFTRDWQAEPDNKGVMQFVGLLVALSGVVVLSAGSAAVNAAR